MEERNGLHSLLKAGEEKIAKLICPSVFSNFFGLLNPRGLLIVHKLQTKISISIRCISSFEEFFASP
jgi:hypothetical protein